jgi:hypothetical protein
VSRRAILPEAELRRCAKVSVETGVSIRARVGVDGSISFIFDPPGTRATNADDDLDAQMGRYLGK